MKIINDTFLKNHGWKYEDDKLSFYHPKYPININRTVGVWFDIDDLDEKAQLEKIDDEIVSYEFHWRIPTDNKFSLCGYDEMLIIITEDDYEHFIKYLEGDKSEENIKTLIHWSEWDEAMQRVIEEIHNEYLKNKNVLLPTITVDYKKKINDAIINLIEE